ncbi:MAG: redoxin domain-containing protein [Micromonosporaceae bacterium]|nr:redoxin domain-containing protein [Micromonosporaceae bacterium]
MFRVAVAAVAGALLLAGCASERSAPEGANPNRYVAADGASQVFPADSRTAAPAVKGELLDGGRFELRKLRGTVVVLNFWASWCAPCRLEAPELQQVHTKTKADGVEFVGVNIRDDKDKALAFDDSFGIAYPSLYDPPGRTAIQFRQVPPNTIPATIVIDREGRVAAVFRKAVLYDELHPMVAKIAAEE